MASMSKNTAPGMCSFSKSDRASRLSWGICQLPSTMRTWGSLRCAASHSDRTMESFMDGSYSPLAIGEQAVWAQPFVVQRLFPAQVRFHGAAAALVRLEHDVVRLVRQARGTPLERPPRRLPRARAALEDTDGGVAERGQGGGGERGGDAVAARD